MSGGLLDPLVHRLVHPEWLLPLGAIWNGMLKFVANNWISARI